MPGSLTRAAPNVAGSAQRVEEARRLLERGKVTEARATLETLLRQLPATALHELGRTYDPYYLGQQLTLNDGSEPRRAAEFYSEAILHGSPVAGYDLSRLQMTYPGMR